MENKKVTIIPADKVSTKEKVVKSNILKVAAYARVSTEEDEQQSSFEVQKANYEREISKHKEWQLVKVFADYGISGTATRKRTEFNKMIEQALNGKIDLILTKSISRFARNTVDTLTIIRELKDKGVEVYFEKENINTLDSKSELILTIMASIAQEETRSISENIKIGKRWLAKQGTIHPFLNNLYGYDQVKNSTPQINPEKAVIIRYIYQLYTLNGFTSLQIQKELEKYNIYLNHNLIQNTLKNEKYKGDYLFQKEYVPNYLKHVTVKNNGTLPQYYINNTHEGIIEKDEWEDTNIEMLRRENIQIKYSSKNPFCDKLICEDCNRPYTKHESGNNRKKKSIVYHCRSRNYTGCKTPSVKENNIKQQFIEIINNKFIKEKVYYKLIKILKVVGVPKQTIEYINQLNENQKKPQWNIKLWNILINKSIVKENGEIEFIFKK